MKDVQSPADLAARIEALGPWFHNLRLDGHETAPGHFLGDFPANRFARFGRAIPADLSGFSVLDIGCNAGFYSFEMKRRGASRVLGIDHDERYLAQARLASEVLRADVEFRRLEVYDVAALGERFDLVLFMGVLYHLRHPLLALDLIREHVARDLLVFQSLQRGADTVAIMPPDAPFSDESQFEMRGAPVLHFVEHAYAGDWSNWWIPNRACSEAMLRTAGFRIEARASDEVLVARVAPVPYADWGLRPAAYPAQGPVSDAEGSPR
jgi:tRNA (mo5U34)-methyltransferase